MQLWIQFNLSPCGNGHDGRRNSLFSRELQHPCIMPELVQKGTVAFLDLQIQQHDR